MVEIKMVSGEYFSILCILSQTEGLFSETYLRKLISILKFLKTPFEFLFHNTHLRKLQQILPQSLPHFLMPPMI